MLPVRDSWVTCSFGVRGSWAAGYHTGIDYKASYDPVYSTTHGKVLYTGRYGGWGSDYGYHVIVAAPGGRRIIYAHLSNIWVGRGQYIWAGTRIGTSGDTGRTTGPHLHYEERVAYYTYWNHRRPIFPGKQAVSVEDLAWSARNEPGTRRSRHRPQVRAYARALHKAGLLPRRHITGHFSKRKKEAVRDLQRRHGVKVTGIPDLVTTRKLGTAQVLPVRR